MVCKKYNIIEYLDKYLESSQFPSKFIWKKIVNKSIYNYENRIVVEKCLIDEALHGFNIVHNNFDMCDIWKVSQSDNNLLKHTTTSIYLISKLFDKPYKQVCPKCGNTTFNNAEHVLLNCINKK